MGFCPQCGTQLQAKGAPVCLLGFYDWLEGEPWLPDHLKGQVGLAWWVSIVAVLGLVGLFAGTIGMSDSNEPQITGKSATS